MNIPEKAKAMVQNLMSKVTPDDDQDVHSHAEAFVDPGEFDDFTDYDSLMVDSKEGAPE